MKIPQKNVFYMLCYAFDVIEDFFPHNSTIEAHENVTNVLARLLLEFSSAAIKSVQNGRFMDGEVLASTPRGRIDISKSIKTGSILSGRFWCDEDYFTRDTPERQIVQSTIAAMLLDRDLNKKFRKGLGALKEALLPTVPVRITSETFRRIQWTSSNSVFQVPVRICELYFNCGIIGPGGAHRLFSPDDTRMWKIFQAFLVNFFRREQSQFKANPERLDWQQLQGAPSALNFVPTLNPDLVLRSPREVIVIDAKFYRKVYQKRFGTERLYSAHICQIFAYVKNIEQQCQGQVVSGMLIYPFVDDRVSLDFEAMGNSFQIRTLDLTQEWSSIKQELLGFVMSSRRLSVSA